MLKLNVKSLPIKDVIENLARGMNVSYRNDCDLYELSIPENYGSGIIRGINFPGGIGLLIYSCNLKSDIEIAFTVSKVHPAKFLYLMDGKLSHRFENETEVHQLRQHQSTIVASSDHNGHVLSLSAGAEIRLYSIEIDRTEFLKTMDCEIDKIENPLHELFYDDGATRAFYHEGGFSLRMFELLKNIKRTSSTGFIRKLHLMSVSLEVLLEQLVSYSNDISLDANNLKVKASDVSLAREAVGILTGNLSKPVNIQDLALALGTNTSKLQGVFHLLYGKSINNKLKDIRVERAARLLETTDKSVGEIVAEIGLVNRGYFSKHFNRVYGVTPQTYRMKFVKDKLNKANINRSDDGGSNN